MASGSVFLLGGGWDDAAFPQTYGRFTAAVGNGSPRIACVLLDVIDRDAYFERSAAAFASTSAADVYPVFVSPHRPLRPADLEEASGVLVGGGLTPAYYDAIVPSAADWLPMLVERGIPYAGFSAGAMIAPSQGIIGGWKLRHGSADLVICSEEVSEDEEYLEIRPGLGLVPFAVDVHASQYGTPTRLLHAVRAGLVPEGWAIDEETMIELRDGEVTVSGLGGAYHVRKVDGQIVVDIHLGIDNRDVT
ncbi:MAG TPA: Type 1 glutamine amidotransferase-like domain-containing protein [Thermomicrobiales bacterium]|nr:Type 1 glutamine amidotransferase-like domain-containing protein [Thermomicrobiales bacterium]